MSEHITVVFEVTTRKAFDTWLQAVTSVEWEGKPTDPVCIVGYRAGDTIERRVALAKFVDRMETVLRQHDHKTTWRSRPIEALVRLMALEWEEFKVAFDLLEVAEARKECIDIANYAMIVDDRLSLLAQDKTMKEQEK